MHAPTRPSPIWTILAVTSGTLALTAAIAAVASQARFSRPIGEGDLFTKEGAAAATEFQRLMLRQSGDSSVRHLRNDLMIESVSLVSSEGEVTASTSKNLIGRTLDSPVLLRGLETSRLSALAQTLQHEVEIDGVRVWSPGDVLYTVMQPLDDNGGLLLQYDLGELLIRRAGAAGIAARTVQLAAGSALLGLLCLGLVLGRARVARHHREVFLEAELLRSHARELEATNAELRAARHSAERALTLAQEKNRIRAEFVLMINHELRTPLTAIVTGTELLTADTDLTDADRRRLIEDMAADGRRLHALIEQMLEAAKIENRGLNLALSSHSHLAICDEIASVNPRVELEPARLEVEAEVWTNPMTLTQLIGSLADNAVTHGASRVTLSCSAEMPVTPTLEVGSAPANAVFFAVSDDGPGIDPEFMPRMFEKFEKRGFTSGTGLGLYLVALMAEALGASLAVTSSQEGTTIVVGVPTQPHLAAEKAA